MRLRKTAAMGPVRKSMGGGSGVPVVLLGFPGLVSGDRIRLLGRGLGIFGINPQTVLPSVRAQQKRL